MFRRNILLKETGPEHQNSTKFIAPEAKKWIKEKLDLHVTNLKANRATFIKTCTIY